MTSKRIALLHTADSNVALFDQAAVASGLGARAQLIHAVRPDLLAEVQAAGGLTEDLAARTSAVLQALAEGADAVVLTCSSLGPAISALGPSSVPIIRADAALAGAVSEGGGVVAVLYAAPTSRDATQQLFAHAFQEAGAVIDLRWVAGAWDAFLAGDMAAYSTLIQSEMGRAEARGVDRIALAQASMSVAASAPTTNIPVLTVPGAALAYLSRRLV
jgi:hypothetical protein